MNQSVHFTYAYTYEFLNSPATLAIISFLFYQICINENLLDIALLIL